MSVVDDLDDQRGTLHAGQPADESLVGAVLRLPALAALVGEAQRTMRNPDRFYDETYAIQTAAMKPITIR